MNYSTTGRDLYHCVRLKLKRLLKINIWHRAEQLCYSELKEF